MAKGVNSCVHAQFGSYMDKHRYPSNPQVYRVYHYIIYITCFNAWLPPHDGPTALFGSRLWLFVLRQRIAHSQDVGHVLWLQLLGKDTISSRSKIHEPSTLQDHEVRPCSRNEREKNNHDIISNMIKMYELSESPANWITFSQNC